MNSDQIKQIIAKYWNKKLWAVAYEVGLCKGGRFRADVLAMSMGSKLVIVEVKSSVADFKTDKKMMSYLKFCDQFYLAVSHEIYPKIAHLIEPGVGVFVVSRLGNARIVKRAHYHKMEAPIRLNVCTRMGYRHADATLHMRKSKTSGAMLVAETAVAAIQAMGKEQRKGNRQGVVSQVFQAISRYV